MIQALQKFSQSWIAKAFLAIVALSFMVFFGGGSWFQSSNRHVIVAEIGTTTINRQQFAEKVQQRIQQVMAQTGQSINREDLLKIGLPQMVLSHLIQENLLNLEAAQLGLTVSDASLRHHIHAIKAFQNKKGEFDYSLFRQVLQMNSLSEEVFLQEVRQDLVREQMMDAIQVGAYVPNEMAERLFDAQYQYRQARLLLISPQDMPIPPAPSLEVLEAFYKENQAEFKMPELRGLTVFTLDPTHLVKKVPVTETEIKSVYEAKAETFGKKTLAEVRGMIIADIHKEKAIELAYQLTQALDDKIAGGATLEELAPQTQGATLLKLDLVDAKGQDRSKKPLAHLPKDQGLAKDILQTGFSLEENTDSPFSQAPNGVYYMVRVDKIIPPALPSFASIKEYVQKVWGYSEQFKAAKTKAEDYVRAFNQGDKKVSLMTLLPNLSLSAPSPSVSNEVKNLVFSLRPHQTAMTFTPQGFAVVTLSAIIPPGIKVKKERMGAFKEALLKQYQGDLVMAYLNALRIRYPVKIHKDVIASLFAQPE